MKYDLFSGVVINHDLPEYNLRGGDVGVVVECIEKPNTETGYIIELFDVQGETVDVVPVLESWVEQPRQKNILTYRELDKVA